MNSLQAIRKHNIDQLLLENAIGIEELANCLAIDLEIMTKKLTSEKEKISDKLARQIEQTFCKPSYWLDSDMMDERIQFDLLG